MTGDVVKIVKKKKGVTEEGKLVQNPEERVPGSCGSYARVPKVYHPSPLKNSIVLLKRFQIDTVYSHENAW